MPRKSNYDKHPFIPSGNREDCAVGFDAISFQLAGCRLLCVEGYPGVFVEELERELTERLKPSAVFRAQDCYKSPAAIRAMLHPHLGDDPVFGRMNGLMLEDWLDPQAVESARQAIERASSEGRVLVIGTGATLLAAQRDALVYAGMARWEIQLRYRRNEIGNLGLDNRTASVAEKYKCGFFAEWRAADRLKGELIRALDFLLDTNNARQPKMIRGEVFRSALSTPRSGRFASCRTLTPVPGVAIGWRRCVIFPKTCPTMHGASIASLKKIVFC
jgi:hypothetical protein